MFAPFFVVKSNMLVQGFFLWMTGPYLAAYITGTLMFVQNQLKMTIFACCFHPFCGNSLVPNTTARTGTVADNLMEQASIWCFFSIAQIGFMLYVIRDVLILHWGRASSDAKSSSIGTQQDADAPYLDLTFIWPMGVIVPDKVFVSEKFGLMWVTGFAKSTQSTRRIT